VKYINAHMCMKDNSCCLQFLNDYNSVGLRIGILDHYSWPIKLYNDPRFAYQSVKTLKSYFVINGVSLELVSVAQ
jgi:hypothetical protein